MLAAKTALVLASLTLTLGCRSPSGPPERAAGARPFAKDATPGRSERVSLVQLITSPERFEGRMVRVQGFCHFEFEEHAVYLHREDGDLMNFANGLWLDTDGDYAGLNETFIVVEGTFTSEVRGHLGAWPGAIQNITRLEGAKSRADYGRMKGARERKLGS